MGKGRERKKINLVVQFRSYPTRNRKFKKEAKKLLKLKYYHYGNISSQNRFGKGQEREKIKIIVSFRSYVTRYRKFRNTSQKIQKIRKIPLWLHSIAKSV